ncbi:MAG: PAS domain-containing protein [Desulfatiglandaceae bacterium]|jgi:PAS domain-containing protein
MESRLSEKETLLRTILDAFPSAVFVVDKNLEIIDFNMASESLTGKRTDLILRKLCGEALGCIIARQSKEGCGTTQGCKECVVRNSAVEAWEGNKVIRRKEVMFLEKEGGAVKAHMLITASPFHHEGKLLVLLAIEDVTKIMGLGGLLPICSHCKKIRNDSEYWENIEEYITTHTGILFSHGICPDCLKEHYGDLMERKKLHQ